MYAVIKTGGKQYRVAAEETITVERLPGDIGDQVIFDAILLHGNGDNATIGTPLVEGASVAGEIVEQTRGPKIRVFKRKRRQTYRRTRGHRQHLSLVRITEILTDGAKPAERKAAAKPKAAKTDEAASGEADAPKPAKTRTKAASKDGATQAKAKAAPKSDEPARDAGDTD